MVTVIRCVYSAAMYTVSVVDGCAASAVKQPVLRNRSLAQLTSFQQTYADYTRQSQCEAATAAGYSDQCLVLSHSSDAASK
jgi:hypothetical protein